MSYQVKTPLLRLFVYFFRYQGFQSALNWLKLKPTLLSTWSLLFSIAFLYINISPRSYLLAAFTSGQASHKKPLVRLLDQYTVQVSYPLCGTVAVLYYHTFSDRIIQTLDDAVLRPAYSGPYVKVQFSVSLAVYILGWAGSYGEFLVIVYQQKTMSLVKKFFSTIYYYSLFNFITIGLLIAHYLHYGVYYRLKMVVNKMEHQQNSLEGSIAQAEEAVQLVRDLARTCKACIRLYSFPVGVFISANLTDVIVCLTTISIEFTFSNILYILFSTAYLIYFAYLNKQIGQCLKVISTTYVNSKLEIIDKIQQSKWQSQIVAACELESVYRELLSIKMFKFFTLDYNFICRFILFIANFSILITQTDQM